MSVTRVHIAQSTRPDHPVPPLSIVGSQPIPDNADAPDAADVDAGRLADALCASLPGATLDRLTAALCARFASRLTVAAPQARS